MRKANQGNFRFCTDERFLSELAGHAKRITEEHQECQKGIVYIQDAVTRHKLGAQYSGEGMCAINRVVYQKRSSWKQFGHDVSSNYEFDQTHKISVNT
jgi:hypothetical protein